MKYNLFEFDNYIELPFDEKEINDFKLFLNQVWESRNLFSDYEQIISEDEIKSEFKEQKQFFLRFDGNKISPRNYIGFINYNNHEINIYPKIFNNNINVTDKECKTYFKYILYWLSYCSKLRFPFSEVDFENQDFDNFLEVFIYLFANYTEKVLIENPFQCYEEITEETSFLRGKISMSEYIKNNLVTGNWQHFTCNYEPFIYDNLFNQILKYTTNLLLTVTKNKDSIEKLNSIKFILDEVSNNVCFAQDCDKIQFNRLFEELPIINSMCKMFLSNQIINNTSDNKSNFCFLLPMEYVFEDFIFGFIKKHFPNTKPESQKSNEYLTKERIFNLQHDIYLNNPKIIIDTKYKIRSYKNGDKKAGIYQPDMYQMVSYAIRQNCNNIVLLYPQKYGINNIDEINFTVESDMFINNKEIKIKALNISITNTNENILNEQISKFIK